MTIAFIDTETTGTDPARHEVWEVAVIVRGHRREDWNGEWEWQLPVDLSKADPAALRIGRYYERISSVVGREARLLSPKAAKPVSEIGKLAWDPPVQGVAHVLARLLDGAVIVAANPKFDTDFIHAFLRRNGQAGTWDYHLQDIGSMVRGFWAGQAAGFRAAREQFTHWHELEVGHDACAAAEAAMREDIPLPLADGPVKLDRVPDLLGIDPISAEDRHSALGDARFLVRCWDAMGGAA